MNAKANRRNRRRKYFYFEKYEVLDGESRYPLLALRQTTEPLTYETWMREFIEFSSSTNGEEPWSEDSIRDYFDRDDDALEVYGGQRIYRRFRLDEISRQHYEVLWNYI